MPYLPSTRRSIFGGGGSPLLPSSKRRPPPRRRLSLSSLIFYLSLLLSSLLLLLYFLFPPPSPSPPHHPHRFTRRPAFRIPSSPTSPSRAADLTTRSLYDHIDFLDADGGAWKQGWPVKYLGSEWDREKLKVFVVPHSHNDPGWKLTVDEYYERQSRRILDTVVEALGKDRRRKFIWEEMSYLERWWRDSAEEKREAFARLVRDGQLEIVGGGWVMNDEVR